MSLVTIDTRELRALGKRLGNFGQTFERLQVQAINRVASRARTTAKREIVAQVNLKSSYVLDRLSFSKGNGKNPVAVIASTIRGVSLSNYPHRQLTKSTKRAKGDAMRGIAAGRKQAGIAVTVKPGSRKKMLGAFLVPRRAGKVSGGNGMGIFIRTGRGAEGIKHLYAPSVSQVFTGVIQRISPEVAADFQGELKRLINVEIKKAIK